MPYRTIKFGAVVTGTEVYKGLVRMDLTSFVLPKIKLYGGALLGKIIVPDDADAIAGAVREF